MRFPRRFLPPISLLSAFEASARHQSFTVAARELNLTQSAVSRQIRALEDLLGSEIFHREGKTVRLTLAGQAYAHEVRAALDRIASATLGFRANPNGGSLNIAILPTFGTRWLGPRLPGFLAAHPGVTINLSTRLSPFDFSAEVIDAAVHFGMQDWPGAELDYLMSETVAAACSPALRDQRGFTRPADLLKAPLLHLASRPDAWERWFAAMGLAPDDVHGMLLDQFALAAQAATAGLGVALLPEFLIGPELARGELVYAVEGSVESSGAYYLALPTIRAGYPPLEAFRAWLQGEARRFREPRSAAARTPPS